MSIQELFNELDYIVLHHFGDLNAAIASERGKELIGILIADENRKALRKWYHSFDLMNEGAEELKDVLEDLVGEQF